MDRPLAANLAQEATVLNVISRAAQTGKSGRFSRGARPDHGLGIGLVCDGQPGNQIPKLLREHGDNLGELIVGDAGFHMEKEVWTAIGKLFDEVFLRFFVYEMPYGRRGQKGQDWVIKPGNPTAVRREFREAMMGMMYGAVEACRATMEEEPTPAQVHKFMLERAKKEPMAFVILSWTRWVEVALMVYDSKNIGAHGDYTLFRQARCLSSVLFAGSNCHGYVCCPAWDLVVPSSRPIRSSTKLRTGRRDASFPRNRWNSLTGTVRFTLDARRGELRRRGREGRGAASELATVAAIFSE